MPSRAIAADDAAATSLQRAPMDLTLIAVTSQRRRPRSRRINLIWSDGPWER